MCGGCGVFEHLIEILVLDDNAKLGSVFVANVVLLVAETQLLI